MKRGALVALLCLMAAGAGAASLTNDDVIKMAKSGLSEQILLHVIESSPSQFDTSPAALIALKEAGVPEMVLSRMLQVSARRDPAARSAAATTPPPPSPSSSEVARCANDSLTDVVLIQAQRRTPLRRDEGEIREDQSSMGVVASALNLVASSKVVTMTFPRSRSDVRIVERLPVFEANQPDGRSPKDFLTIVRLKGEGPVRKIETVRGKNGAVVWSDQAILPDYRLEATADSGPSCRTRVSPTPVVPARIRPAKPLAPGEYAVVRDGAALFTFGLD